VHFSVLALLVIVHVISNPQKLLYANFWNIVERGNILKTNNIHFFCYTHNSFTISDSKLIFVLISKLFKHLYSQILKKNKFASSRTTVSPCSFFIGKTSLKWLRHLRVNPYLLERSYIDNLFVCGPLNSFYYSKFYYEQYW